MNYTFNNLDPISTSTEADVTVLTYYLGKCTMEWKESFAERFRYKFPNCKVEIDGEYIICRIGLM